MTKMTSCPHCGKSLIHYRMKKHIQVVHGDKKWFCNKCDKKYNQEDNLQRHIRVIHEGHREICPHCGRHLKSELSKHIEQVHKERIMVSCEYCDKQYSRKYVLQSHVKSVHEGEMIQCDYCPFKGKQRRYILEHVKKEHPSKKLNEMQLEKVTIRSNPHSAIMERFKLLMDKELKDRLSL